MEWDMGMGMGFLLGAFAGLVLVGIAAVVVVAARRASGKNVKNAREMAALADAAAPVVPAPDAPTRVLPRREADARAAGRREPAGSTMIVEAVESREKELSSSIQEVRDMLLKLAGVIAKTTTASGDAKDAFNSAKDAVSRVQPGQSAGLQEAQRLLLAEIDRVLSTNETLHAELANANKGIAEQRRQIEELRTQARVDSLTRIPNRAAFDERLAEYIGLLERTALVFSLLLIDIDHFKRVNDVHGHVAGDRILRGTASKIAVSIRANDFAARYGGEEFAVILPGATAKEAYEVADRMRQDISKTNFRLDQTNLRMTISGGIAECVPTMLPAQLIAAADKALYEAKNTGRNRIVLAPKG